MVVGFTTNARPNARLTPVHRSLSPPASSQHQLKRQISSSNGMVTRNGLKSSKLSGMPGSLPIPLLSVASTASLSSGRDGVKRRIKRTNGGRRTLHR